MESNFLDLLVFQQVQGFCFKNGDFRARKNLEIEILMLASGTSPTSLTSDRGIKHTSSLGRLVSDIPETFYASPTYTLLSSVIHPDQ